MAIIVQDNISNKFYVLIGAGYGTSEAGPFFPMSSSTKSSESERVAVANSDGDISWLPSYQLTVVSVDGQSCKDLLSQ